MGIIWQCLLYLINALPLFHFCHSKKVGEITVHLPRKQKIFVADEYLIGGFPNAGKEEMVFGKIECEQSIEPCAQHGKLQGEFLLPDIQTVRSVDSNNRILDIISSSTTRWPDTVVHYEIGEGFSIPMVNAIKNGFWTWTQNSPARFIESSSATDRVQIVALEEKACLSNLGKIGGVQMVGLDYQGACPPGVVTHELGHVLGWIHEHQRPDRDSYIKILDNNIQLGYESQYDVEDESFYGNHPYDYGSILHYPQNGFATDDGDAFQPVAKELQNFLESYPNDLPSERVGQRLFLSTLDKEMSYTYLTGCINDANADQSASTAQWSVGLWGGCNPQCNGTSFRQRTVHCRYKGVCQNDQTCDGLERPASRQSCELSIGNLNVTFDEDDWSKVGGMMANVPLYDQNDWQLWSGSPPEFNGFGQLTGDSAEGPGSDASETGDGRYLWFSAYTPLIKNDQAWYESPVVGTTNEQSCGISFDWFIAGDSGTIYWFLPGDNPKLQLELVSCQDCWDKQVLWQTSTITATWSHATVTVPRSDAEVKIRFVAVRGTSSYGNIGIDNIVFSEGCIRPDIEEVESTFYANQTTTPMMSPYTLKTNCIYIPPVDFVLSILSIVMIGLGLCVCCACSAATVECLVRKRVLMKRVYSAKASGSKLEMDNAARVLRQMNPKSMRAIISTEASNRIGSVRHLAFTAKQSMSEVKGSMKSFRLDSLRAPSNTSLSGRRVIGTSESGRRVNYHRNKSVMGIGSSNRKLSNRFGESVRQMQQFADEAGIVGRVKAVGRSIKSTAKDIADEKGPIGSVHEINPQDIGVKSLSMRSFRKSKKNRRVSKPIFHREGMLNWLEDGVEASNNPCVEGSNNP